MRNVLPPHDFTVEPLVGIKLSSPLVGLWMTTDLLDLFRIRRGLDSESLDTYIVSIQLALPNIREPPRSVRDSVTRQCHFGSKIRFRQNLVCPGNFA